MLIIFLCTLLCKALNADNIMQLSTNLYIHQFYLNKDFYHILRQSDNSLYRNRLFNICAYNKSIRIHVLDNLDP